MDVNEMGNALHTPIALYQWAMRLYRKGDREEAVTLLEQALEKMERTYGTHHPLTANCLNSLGVLCQEQGEYTKALPLLERALTIRLASMGREHPATAGAYNNLAAVYDRLGATEKALALYEQAIAIMERYGDANHPRTLTMCQNREELLRRMKDELSSD